MNKTNTVIATKNKKEKIMVLCLCPRCANDFRDSGNILVQRGWQAEKESCDFCQVGRGIDFGVFPKKQKNTTQEVKYGS